VTSPIAAIDCGTNTIKLLIAEAAPGGRMRELVREARMVRLGQDVDRTGRLAPEAMARTFAAVDEYAAAIAEHGVERIRFCATSATRDSANAAEFADGVRARLGVAPEVLTGAEEAALAFAGSVDAVPADRPRPVLVVDIGGGSTELISGHDVPTAAYSMDVGSVRLHERHLHSDPPTADEIAALLADVDAVLDACPVDPAAAGTVLGVAGTVTTLAAGALGLPAYERAAIHGAVLPVGDVVAVVGRIVAMTVAERRALGYLHPGRADVIGAGGLILRRILERSGASTLLVSEADILDGIAASLVAER